MLLEHECYTFLRSAGVAVPAHTVVFDAGSVSGRSLEGLGGNEVMLKALSPALVHKSDLGAVVRISKDAEVLRTAIEEMSARLQGIPVAGYLISECIDGAGQLDREYLISLRHTRDFGPVLAFGPGGVHAELLSQANSGLTLLSPTASAGAEVLDRIAEFPFGRVALEGSRGHPPRISPEELQACILRLYEIAYAFVPGPIEELEINPLIASSKGLVAVDCVIRLSAEESPARAPVAQRPVDKIAKLLHPESIGIIGVSERMNPGRIILENILSSGFDPSQIQIVKPGIETLRSCRCYPDVSTMPRPVDLFILSVSAAQTPGLIEELVRLEKAEALIVIPGGLEEREGSEDLTTSMHESIAGARKTEWRGPVINGGNCLGIRSRPGNYDTLFIPPYKLPPCKSGKSDRIAFLSQSGAFAVSQASKLTKLDPKYIITFGNQSDLTLGDYLSFFADDDEIDLHACYIEGFKELDGLRFLGAAKRIRDKGSNVLLYRAGRSPAGASASASHTASIAGDYEVSRQLAESAGVIVADSLADFEELMRLFALLGDRRPKGWHLGALSNAGFECVAMADRLGRFELADFSPDTRERLMDDLTACRLEDIVGVRNPLDVTPIMSDSRFELASAAVIEEPDVDVAVIGCVPLSGALHTLPKGEGHHEDIKAETSIVQRLASRFHASSKPWVTVVDAGPMYDPMAGELRAAGVPCFRNADRALRLLERWCAARMR